MQRCDPMLTSCRANGAGAVAEKEASHFPSAGGDAAQAEASAEVPSCFSPSCMDGRMMSRKSGEVLNGSDGEGDKKVKVKLTPSTGVAPISVAEYAPSKRKTGIKCMVGGCCTTRGQDEARRAITEEMRVQMERKG